MLLTSSSVCMSRLGLLNVIVRIFLASPSSERASSPLTSRISGISYYISWAISRSHSASIPLSILFRSRCVQSASTYHTAYVLLHPHRGWMIAQILWITDERRANQSIWWCRQGRAFLVSFATRERCLVLQTTLFQALNG